MDDTKGAIVKVVPAIAELDPESWDKCANPDPTTYNPFISYAFLEVLERSGCVCDDTGWQPQHLAVMSAQKEDDILACMPCYLKNHSQGEYVFDYAWADAFERAGGTYYPKLQCCVPFTPAPGRRFLTAPGPNSQDHEKLLAAAVFKLSKRLDVSSFHTTFIDEDAWTRLSEFGFLRRIDQQFHWTNSGYESFEDFLATLASRKRKAIRKERKTATENGIEITQLTGSAITEAHWDSFYRFYLNTSMRKWGQPYLNRKFFSLLGEEMADQCLLIFAERDGKPIAGALNMIGGDSLYGRNWGAIEHHPCLHFELCYYQAIDFAINHNIARVEAGAQGEHKLARGYMPTTTYSLHWFADPRLQNAVDDYLDQERSHMERTHEILADYGPYKKTTC
ncbi:MAG: GNAT family N-acetyltransferase [Hyphomicrobiaceae bacterium]